MALPVLLVCTLRVGWPLGRSVVVAFGAGCTVFGLLYVVSLATNDGTRGGFRRRASIDIRWVFLIFRMRCYGDGTGAPA